MHFFRIAFSALFLLIMMATLVPWMPHMVWAGLDPSYLTTLQYAKQHNLSFGTDIVFTYGPASVYLFPFSWYAGGEYWHILVIRISYCIVAFLAFQRLAGSLPIFDHICASVLLLVGLVSSQETLFVSLPLLLLALQSTRTTNLPLTVLLVLSMAFMAHAKATWAILALGILFIADCDRVLRMRQLPLLVAAYVVFSIVLFVGMKQPLNVFVHYIVNAYQTVSGHTEAMHSLESSYPATKTVLYIITAALGLFILLSIIRKTERKQNYVVFIGGILATMFITFKAGFVRPGQQTTIALGSLIIISSLIYILGAMSQHTQKEKNSAFLMCIVSMICLSMVGATEYKSDFLGPRISGIRDALRIMPRFLGEQYQTELNARLSNSFERVRSQHPLPQLDGTVDIMPWNTTILIAHGLQYTPRPVFQSYVAYTQQLLELNKKHFILTPPEYLVFNVRPIDGRYPAFDDSLTWPLLLSRYELYDDTHFAPILKLRSTAHEYAFVTSNSVSATLNDMLVIPAVLSNSLVWAQLNVELTFIGKALTMFYKPPRISMAVETADNSVTEYRFVPEIARSGFLLSPRISSENDFLRAINEIASPVNGDAARVVSVRLVAGRLSQIAYRPQYTAVFRSLIITER